MSDRIIKESICISDTLNQLTDFEERFWHRLVVNCDDYGRFDARPAVLKGRLFPLMDGKTQKDMSGALDKLASVGLIELYEVDGRPFLHVVTWDKYQRIRAKRSKFPPPVSTCCQMTSNVPVIQSNTIRIQSESNPKEGCAGEPHRFSPPSVDDVRIYCQENGYHVDAESFVSFYASKGWMIGKNKMKNWKQAVATWEKRWKEEHGGHQQNDRESKTARFGGIGTDL